jgi:ATP-dependent helicase/nuclease subunit A
MSRHKTLPRLTNAQRAVVLASHAHLLVGAGAGSGKTSTVVQKLCYLLGGAVMDADGATYLHPAPISISEVAAITFTNEAAADLKRKLRTALVMTGLHEIAMDVDAARIGTIHSFCGDLLRDFALRAGLPPLLDVLTDGESGALAETCAQLAVQRAALAGPDDDLNALLEQRSLRTVIGHVAALAEDSDRLNTWSKNVAVLRAHERALLVLAQHARAERERELAAQRALDFDRMIVATRDLLRDSNSVRHAVQRQLRLLVVDEFQDVDPAQRDIAYLLGGVTQPDAAPTSIMLVGDPKQSIYRFRRADVSLWNAVATDFTRPGFGQRLDLTDNFRSRDGILALVDTFVGPQLDEVLDPSVGRQPYEVDYAPLVAAGDERVGDRCVEVIAIGAREDGAMIKIDEVRVAEARAIAERIRALHADGDRFGDMALVLSAFSSVDIFSTALRNAAIPVYVLRGEGFWETREVLDCVLALRAIRDPADDVALAGFLRGPMVGVNDATLLALADARDPRGLHGAMASESRERPLLDRAAALLECFGALRDRLPVDELLRRLLGETGLLVTLLHDAERGKQAIANVRKLLRMTAAVPEQSVGEFLREVREARAREDRQGEERLYRERADVVTITTIHSAKGLEWPIVFWSDLARGVVESSGALQCGRDFFRLKLEVGATDKDGKIVDPDYVALKDALLREQTAEWFRLWYVASTRAKRRLILTGIPQGTMRKGPPSVASALLARFPALASADDADVVAYVGTSGQQYELVVHVAIVQDTEPNGSLAPARHQEFTSEELARFAPQPRVSAPAGRTRLSATQLMTFAHDSARWHDRYVRGFDPEKGSPWRSGSGSSATTGTIVHDVLERFNYEIADISELVESAIKRHNAEAPDANSVDGAVYRARIRTMLQMALGSAAWSALHALPHARHELTFVRILRDGSTIDGAIDLIAVDGATARIVDVKTGGGHDIVALGERYQVQAAVYASAVRAIAGYESTFALLHTTDGDAIPIDPTGVDVSALIEAMRHSIGWHTDSRSRQE